MRKTGWSDEIDEKCPLLVTLYGEKTRLACPYLIYWIILGHDIFYLELNNSLISLAFFSESTLIELLTELMEESKDLNDVLLNGLLLMGSKPKTDSSCFLQGDDEDA